MSYTIPEYVDTREQAVLAVASAIKGEAVTGGDGSVNRALDILADVLAEQDVSVLQTDAGAILALAQYASGMVKPEGTIAITENGEGIDVSQYATADVSVSGGGGSSTQTLTVTKNSESDTVSVTTQSWADYIAGTGVPTEIQPDSIEGLVNTYSIPVGAVFFARFNYDALPICLDARMTKPFNGVVMPSTPLYASSTK